MSNPSFPKPYPKQRPPAKRPSKMEVLALGMSRTGTIIELMVAWVSALYVALGKLGYKSYHMAECGLDSRNDSLALWRKAINAKYHGKGQKFAGRDFDQMLWRYNAVTDIPSVLFVDELLAAYPDAKVVITSRPVGRWAASMDRSFYEILGWKRWPLLQLIDRLYTRHYIPLLKSTLAAWTGATWQDRARLPAGFAAHYEHVRAATKAQGRQVLEFRSEDGWEPLCSFLGKDVPNEAYPRVNEGDYVAKVHVYIFWMRLIVAVTGALVYVAPLAVAGGAWWYYTRLLA